MAPEIEVRTARAAERPCGLYAYHSPKVVRTQGHHLRPVYLQNRVYGRIQDSSLMWLCGNCHDSVHEWLSWLLREAREPEPHPGRYAKMLAQGTYNWFVAAMKEKDSA